MLGSHFIDKTLALKVKLIYKINSLFDYIKIFYKLRVKMVDAKEIQINVLYLLLLFIIAWSE